MLAASASFAAKIRSLSSISAHADVHLYRSVQGGIESDGEPSNAKDLPIVLPVRRDPCARGGSHFSRTSSTIDDGRRRAEAKVHRSRNRSDLCRRCEV